MPEDFFPDAVPCTHERTSVSGRYCIDCFEELEPGTKRPLKVDRWGVEDKAVHEADSK